MLKIYTDGACSGNPGPGGYAAVIVDNNNDITMLSGSHPDTTNNRMELTAVIEVLKKIDQNSSLEIITDSEYVYKGITIWIYGWIKKGWKSKTGEVKNQDLWQELYKQIQGKSIKWSQTRGHSGDKYNEMADQLAVRAIQS